MVWATIIFGLLSIAADVFLYLEHQKAMRLKVEISKVENLLTERNNQLNNSIALHESEKSRADATEKRYYALVDKIEARATKPDDGIIHAKNSGDVRRLFEQQVAALERDKQQEN